MSDKSIIPDPPSGCLFVDPKTLPGDDYIPVKEVIWDEAKEYARKAKEEGREVAFDEMQRFVKR